MTSIYACEHGHTLDCQECWPAIIDGPGEYTTRNGTKVVIYRVDPQEKSTFNCKGSIVRRRQNGGLRTSYQIWAQNGRFKALGEHQYDIVRKL